MGREVAVNWDGSKELSEEEKGGGGEGGEGIVRV